MGKKLTEFAKKVNKSHADRRGGRGKSRGEKNTAAVKAALARISKSQEEAQNTDSNNEKTKIGR